MERIYHSLPTDRSTDYHFTSTSRFTHIILSLESIDVQRSMMIVCNSNTQYRGNGKSGILHVRLQRKEGWWWCEKGLKYSENVNLESEFKLIPFRSHIICVCMFPHTGITYSFVYQRQWKWWNVNEKRQWRFIVA